MKQKGNVLLFSHTNGAVPFLTSGCGAVEKTAEQQTCV